MTVLVATSVLGGSAEGESHGAIHLVDVAQDRIAQVVDWKGARCGLVVVRRRTGFAGHCLRWSAGIRRWVRRTV